MAAVKNGLIGSLRWHSLYMILLLQRNRKTSCSLWLRNEAVKGELWMSGTENNTWNVCFNRHLFQIYASNLDSNFELHFTDNLVVLHYKFFLSRKWSMMPTRNCFPNRKRCLQIRCFVICWTSACVRLQRTTNRCRQWRGQIYEGE